MFFFLSLLCRDGYDDLDLDGAGHVSRTPVQHRVLVGTVLVLQCGERILGEVLNG